MSSNLTQKIINEYFSVVDGQMQIGNIAVSKVAETIGTPAYVYDANILRSQYQKVREIFNPRVSILFALKSNSNAAFANILKEAGSGAEVASAGEIEIAKAAGFNGENVHFAGPGKTERDLEYACKFSVSSINIESAGELERLERVTKRLGKRAKASIRVQQPETLKGSRMRMSGGDSKFGVPIDDVPSLVEEIHSNPAFDFGGLHLYAGTQCFDSDAWVGMANTLFELTESIEKSSNIKVPHLNFGGGFGVPIFDGDPTFDLDSAARGLDELIAKDANLNRKYFIELGRYLAAPSGIYLMRVTDIKTSGDKKHVILNGGMHQHAAAVGLGSLIKRSYPIVLPERMDEEPDTAQCLGGPLCLPADEISSNVNLPSAQPGDLVAVLISGAYGLSYSPVLFLGHPLPAEAIIQDQEIKLIREPGKPEDILRGQITPSPK
jgi:diaminopimelate decarboxylase